MLEIQISLSYAAVLISKLTLDIDSRPYLFTLTVRNQVHRNEITSPGSQTVQVTPPRSSDI